MAKRHGSSRRRKKAIVSDIPAKPTANLTDAMRQERSADGEEVFGNAQAPKKPMKIIAKSRIRGSKIRVRTPKTARELGRVYIKEDNNIQTFDADILRCLTSSTTSLNYESVCTDKSFERRKREGIEITQVTEMVLDSETIDVVGSQKEDGCEEDSLGVFDSVPAAIHPLNHPAFTDMLMSDKPPAYGDFELFSSKQQQAREEQDVIRETMLSALNEFFANTGDGIALAIRVEKSRNRPVLKIQFEKIGDSSEKTLSLSQSLSEFDEASTKNVKRISSKVENHFRFGRHRNDRSSTTSGTSLSGSPCSSSAGITLSSNQVSSTSSGVENKVNSSNISPSNVSVKKESSSSLSSFVSSVFSYLISFVRAKKPDQSRKKSSVSAQ